jgi:hypothetical protein
MIMCVTPHSDIGGSYAENESRLSDVSLTWMADAAITVRGGIKIDKSALQLYPSPDGMQHDERKVGFPVLSRWLLLTWQEKQRNVADPNAASELLQDHEERGVLGFIKSFFLTS